LYAYCVLSQHSHNNTGYLLRISSFSIRYED
jgi:hypothetical protein